MPRCRATLHDDGVFHTSHEGTHPYRLHTSGAYLRRPNVLSLSRARPYRAWLATRKRRAKRGAEAPGQRTAARRLLRRVGPPVPYRSCRNGRIVPLKMTIFVSWVVELCRSTLSVHPLRGES